MSSAKISDLIKEKYEKKEPFFSFEFFPPKTYKGVQNLYDRLYRMSLMKPLFIDVTWGAGGSTSDLTMEICATAHKFMGYNVQMHLTCTNMPMEKFQDALRECKNNGMRNILALRGDPPRGEEWRQIEGGFAHAVDLVKFIRQEYGDYFCIGVAGYPEKHVDSPAYEEDLQHLKEKVDAGADLIITQLFYDVDAFLKYVKDCRAIGITVPILPGIMPIRSYPGLIRMCDLGGTKLPEKIKEDLQPIKDDDRAVQDYGVKVGIEMCQRLLNEGVYGLHFYTLNLERSTREILLGLGLMNEKDLVRPLPWLAPRRPRSPSRTKKNGFEDVRPIYWANRPNTYIARTEDWDEFPNGRWGDSGSPSFGMVGEYHLTKLYPTSKSDALQFYGHPTTEQEVYAVFAKYLKGEIDRLPWNDQPLAAETGPITENLVRLNLGGILTVNSQPRVNACESADPVHGWGGPNGYVFQKAYIEFFISPALFEKLRESIKSHKSLTYQATNRKGEAEGNLTGIAAVTWGVFPSSQIKQPTIVDRDVFQNVWKDEAFALWESAWRNLYEVGSASYELIDRIASTYYLVTIIDDNFISGDIFRVFEGVVQ